MSLPKILESTDRLNTNKKVSPGFLSSYVEFFFLVSPRSVSVYVFFQVESQTRPSPWNLGNAAGVSVTRYAKPPRPDTRGVCEVWVCVMQIVDIGFRGCLCCFSF